MCRRPHLSYSMPARRAPTASVAAVVRPLFVILRNLGVVPIWSTFLSATTPKFGSLEWEAEKQEAERREPHIRKVTQEICRSC